MGHQPDHRRAVGAATKTKPITAIFRLRPQRVVAYRWHRRGSGKARFPHGCHKSRQRRSGLAFALQTAAVAMDGMQRLGPPTSRHLRQPGVGEPKGFLPPSPNPKPSPSGGDAALCANTRRALEQLYELRASGAITPDGNRCARVGPPCRGRWFSRGISPFSAL